MSMPNLHRLVLAAVAVAAAASLPLSAQTSPKTVAVRIQTSLPGGSFWVDGTEYQSSAQFVWVEGTKHILEVRKALQINWLCDARWRFQGWALVNGQLLEGNSPVQIYTTDPEKNSLVANFQLEYRLDVSINGDAVDTSLACLDEQDPLNQTTPKPPLPPNPAGFVQTTSGAFKPDREAHECLSTSGWAWMAANSTVNLNAVPYPGFAFAGWMGQTQLPGNYMGQVVMTGPRQMLARFVDARRVTFLTAPVAGLSVVVDREIVRTRAPDSDCLLTNRLPGTPAYPIGLVPGEFAACKMVPLCNGEFDFVPGSQHILGAPPAQRDTLGRMWVFDHWDLGPHFEAGDQNTVVTIPQTAMPYVFTARFVRGGTVTLATSPASLRLRVDGRDGGPAYVYQWGVGHVHTVEAPLEQTDSKGRRWRFVRWSNGGPSAQEVSLPEGQEEQGLRLTAEYELLGQLTLRSEPASLTVSVNGEECVTPCVLDRPAGEEAIITALPERSFSEDTRIEFSGWNDTTSLERTYRFSHEAETLTARYQYLHRLTLLSDPEEAAVFKLTPAASPEGFFTAGVRIQLEVEAKPGFKFRRLEGALTGTMPTGSLTMNRPYTVAARFDRVPELPEGAVRNAAGETPDNVVAPGSLIAVRGRHLAPYAETGFFNPLKQTLAGVTVHAGERILPLLYVSPEEIIAQLPSTVPPGEHKLTVRQQNQPPVTVDFTVAPYAPGLFTQPEQELPYAEIYHADGRPVTPEDPAKPGLTLLLTGTGFGPTNPVWLDGFATPESPALPLRDAVELLVEGEPHPILWAGAQPNRVGRNMIRFVLGPVLPNPETEGHNLKVRVRVQERHSNTVLLPVAPPQ